jgi:hypothetical protein
MSFSNYKNKNEKNLEKHPLVKRKGSKLDSKFNEAKGNGSLLYTINPQHVRRKCPKILGPHGR